MSDKNLSAVEGAPEITELDHLKFEVFRLEQEEKQLGFLAGAHGAQMRKQLGKGKHGHAALHGQHQKKLLEELKVVRADLNEMKDQLDSAT